MGGEHPTSVRLEPDLKRALKRVADERHWSISYTISQVLKAWLDSLRKKK